jgi:hypothetical protein
MTERTPGEEAWLRTAAGLSRDRFALAAQAAGGYPDALRVAGTPLLAPPAWRLPAPVPLDAVRLEFRPDAPAPRLPGLAGLAPHLLPLRPDGHRDQRYSDLVGRLTRPSVFENRPVYRLLDAALSGPGGPVLRFGRGRYFDAIDAGGAAGHEYAAARSRAPEAGPGDAGYPYRGALGGPFGLDRRCATLAVSALTLRYDRAAVTATFPLHYREPGQVGHAGGLYQVLPVGVFQPSGEAPWNEGNDFSLWRGLLREYAEEFLGADEDHGSEAAPIIYAAWPLARALAAGLADGRVRAWCLGLGADPLTFAVDLLAVVVIDAPLFDELFSGLVNANAEGQVIKARPFTASSVGELLDGAPLQAAAAGLLALALGYRELLLGDG